MIIPYLLLAGGCTVIPVCRNIFWTNHAELRKESLAKMLPKLFGLIGIPVIIVVADRQLTLILVSVFVIALCIVLIALCIHDHISLRTILSRLLEELALPMVRYFTDWMWIRALPDIESLSRPVLMENLKQHTTPRWRRAYVESLLQNKVKLTDNWPDKTRPQYNDDELNYNLMKLDCADMNALRKPF